METNVYDFHIRVLLYKDSGDWVAHALEMDLVDYGDSVRAALKELNELVSCQISFAHQKRDDSLIYFPADKELFERWEAAHTAALKKEILPDKSVKMNTKAVFITFSKSELSQIIRRKFSPAKEMEFA